MARLEDENKNKQKTLFKLWIQSIPPNTYYRSISNQSMERLEDENKNKQKNAIPAVDPT